MAGSAKRDAYGPRAAALGSGHKGGDAVLDRAVQAQIGDKLRKMYGDLADQPVPDRFTALLSKLGTSGQGNGS